MGIYLEVPVYIFACGVKLSGRLPTATSDYFDPLSIIASASRPLIPDDRPFDTATTDTPNTAPPPPKFSSPFQEALFILLTGLSQLFSVGNLGLTAFPIRPISHALAAPLNAQTSYFLASYSLSIVLITGRLGDHFGHKHVFVFGWVDMAIWSLVSVVVFDVAKAMAGVGNGVLVPNSFALLARAFPPFSGRRNVAFVFLGFCAPAGYIFGGVVGAAFAEKGSWRWGFLFWAIGSLVLRVASFCVVPYSVGSRIPGLSLKHFDYVGTVLGLSGLVLFGFAWNQAPVVGWHEPYTYALLAIGIVLIVAFAFS